MPSRQLGYKLGFLDRIQEQEKLKDDIELIDYLKTSLNYRSDAQLAEEYLNISRHAIYRIRAGAMDLGSMPRLKVIEKTGYLRSVTHIKSLAAKNLAEEIARRIEDYAAIMALSKIDDDESYGAHQQLLKLIKPFLTSRIDEELANAIGLKRTSVSMVRKGKSKFGIYPRLKILQLLDPEANLDELQRVIDSSEELLRILSQLPQVRLQNPV